MAEAVVLTLPEPPSSNRYWRHGRGVTYRSAEAKAYIGEVFVLVWRSRDPRTIASPCLSGDIALSLDWYRSRRSGDLDNRIKIVLDALEAASLYGNDSQVVELHAYRHEDKANPRVIVTARALPAPLRSA